MFVVEYGVTMKDFQALALLNRLGQSVMLDVKHETMGGRDYVFVAAPVAKASSIIAKNAEQFARQLLEHFSLQSERFDLIEIRDQDNSDLELIHWRFDWYGPVAMKSRSQVITAERRISSLLGAVAA